jgi:hypothetical protein
MIPINEKYRITSDTMNVIVEQLIQPKDATKEPAWKQVAYFAKPEQAVQYVLDRETRLSDAATLRELIGHMRAVRDEIREVAKKFNETELSHQKSGGEEHEKNI